MKKASWMLLTFDAAVVLIFAVVSVWFAYSGNYPVAGGDVSQIAPDRPQVEAALRGIRGTSAAFGVGFALMFLLTAIGPYRRGEAWAWWAIVSANAAIGLLVALRVPTLGIRAGVGATLIHTGFAVIAALLDVGRLKTPPR